MAKSSEELAQEYADIRAEIVRVRAQERAVLDSISEQRRVESLETDIRRQSAVLAAAKEQLARTQVVASETGVVGSQPETGPEPQVEQEAFEEPRPKRSRIAAESEPTEE